MKKIILIILCVMLSLSLPALATPEQSAELSTKPNSLEQVTQRLSDISTDLKLQQQKLDFFKESLEVQDKRIGDLSLYLACFGGLMTLMVVFFSLRSTKEAVQAAKEEARKEIQAEANKIVEDQLNPLIEETLNQIDEQTNVLNQIHEQTKEELKKLEEERLRASQMNDKGSQLIEEYKNKIIEIDKIKEIFGSRVDKDKPVNMEQGQKAKETAKILDSRDNFIQAENVSSGSIEQAGALLNKGITLGQMGKNQEAIDIYDEVVQRFGEATEASLLEHVASALVNKGITLGKMGNNQEEIAIYDEVVQRFGKATEAPLREQVAKALVNKGINFYQMRMYLEAIANYDEVVRRFGEAMEAPLRELVAIALMIKGLTLGQTGNNQEAITNYDEVVRRFGEATEVPLREEVAKALVNKGINLYRMRMYQEAIANYDEVVRRFGEATEAPLREQVAIALQHKKIMLRKNEQNKEKE